MFLIWQIYHLGVRLKGDSYFLPPIWKREYRAQYLDTKKDEKQEKIAMKWKFPFLSKKEEELKDDRF